MLPAVVEQSIGLTEIPDDRRFPWKKSLVSGVRRKLFRFTRRMWGTGRVPPELRARPRLDCMRRILEVLQVLVRVDFRVVVVGW